MRELIFEYDRTKARPKCPGCQKFYKLLDDVTADDEKNVVQLTPHKARINIKKEFMDEFEDKDIIAPDVIIPKAEPILKSMMADPVVGIPIADKPKLGLWGRIKALVKRLFR